VSVDGLYVVLMCVRKVRHSRFVFACTFDSSRTSRFGFGFVRRERGLKASNARRRSVGEESPTESFVRRPMM